MNPRRVARWLTFARLSIYLNLALALGKLLFGLYFQLYLISVHALYNLGIALAKRAAIRGYRCGGRPIAYQYYQQTGLLVLAFSLIYMLGCCRLFLQSSSVYYPTVVAISIAAVTFAEIAAAAYGLILTRGGKAPALAALKMTNLAAALISLVLTQTALLSFAHGGDLSFYNGVAGLVFGGCAAGIGAGMFLWMRRLCRRAFAPGTEVEGQVRAWLETSI